MKQQFQTLQAQMDLGVAQNQAPSAALQATLGQTQQLQSRMAEASGSEEMHLHGCPRIGPISRGHGNTLLDMKVSVHFTRYTGAGHGGNAGQWMQRVDPKRDVSALARVLEGPRASTSELHRALVAVCKGPASLIAEGGPCQ